MGRPTGEITGAIFDIVRQAAVENMPCPTNSQMRQMLGYDTDFTVSHAIHKMAGRGLFELRRHGNSRQIVFPDGEETLCPLEAIEDVIAKAGAVFDVLCSAIFGPERNTKVIRARHAAMAVACEAGYARALVGRVLARDHSTVCHAIDMVGERERRNARYSMQVQELRYAAGMLPDWRVAA